MPGLTREQYDEAAREIQAAWARAQTRDAGFDVVVQYGRKYGYKNVIAAIQGRVPRQFEREKTLEEFIREDNERAAGEE